VLVCSASFGVATTASSLTVSPIVSCVGNALSNALDMSLLLLPPLLLLSPGFAAEALLDLRMNEPERDDDRDDFCRPDLRALFRDVA
jgi:hypothetical protein